MNKITEWLTTTVGNFKMPGDKVKSFSIFASIVMIVLILIGVSTCKQKEREQENLIQSLKASKDSVHHFRDENDRLHNKVQSLVLSNKQFQEIGEQLGFKVDSMKKVVKNLLYYYKGQIKEEGNFMFSMEDGGDTTTFEVVPGVIDSKDKFPKGTKFSTTKTFNFSNGFLNLEGKYSLLTDSVKGKYVYQTGFELSLHEEKKGLFKPTLTYADIVLTDPNASLIKGKSVLVTQKKKWYDTKGAHIAEGLVLGSALGYGAAQVFK